MKEIEHFYFGHNQGLDNGFRSMNYGIINCTIGGGMIEENYIPSREIRETYVRGNPKPYFHSADLKPVELKLTFGFENFHTGFTPDDRNRALRDLSRWLTKDYYVPFGVAGSDKMFYVMYVGESELIHNANSQGYIELTLRTNAPWAYSEIKTKEFTFDPTVQSEIHFENIGDLPIEPELWFKVPFSSDVADVSIVINNNTDNIFKFEGLLSQEEIYVHNEMKYIESINTPNYRYDNFNNNYLSIPTGNNTIVIQGIENLKMKYQERTYLIY